MCYEINGFDEDAYKLSKWEEESEYDTKIECLICSEYIDDCLCEEFKPRK